MTLDARTPVLVGVGVVQQREDDPARALEPVALMAAALERAGRDAGSPALLTRADSIRVPRGLWEYRDPARLVAERLGARGARTELTELGVLQTALFAGAAADIAAGRADVVLVTGGEARHRALRAQQSGGQAPLTAQPDGAPDVVHRPAEPVLSEREIRAGLVRPVEAYALIENALRAADGLSLDAHRRQLAELQAGFSRIAAGNPDAWSREPVSAEVVGAAGPGNRMLAFPYAKLHCSQWNVDQAAGLVFCSAGTARALGVPRERWILPRAVAESNAVVPLAERRALGRCPGFARAAERALARAGCALTDVALLELYSCFPAAVRIQLRELGIGPDRPLSVTGGMTFAGGPLNSFVLQALARMADRLRETPGSVGLVSAVSGFLNKQGVSLWSTEPGPDAGFQRDDVSQAAERDLERTEWVTGAEGPARLASYTVLYDAEQQPLRALLLCDLADGRRTLVGSDDPELALAMTREEFCGRTLQLAAGGRVALT